jgi:glycosyltransferase involved in cell wall biosynthesis
VERSKLFFGLNLAIVNEPWNGGATRCAQDLKTGLQEKFHISYYPEHSDSASGGLFDWLSAVKPDVVHLHSFYGWLPYDTLRKVASRYRTVFTPHDTRPIGQMDPLCYRCNHNDWCLNCPLMRRSRRYSIIANSSFWSRLNKKWVHNRTPSSLQIVGVSEWLIRRMKQQELRRFPIHHIPNGVDVEFFRRIEDARCTLRLPEDSEIIFFLSSPGPRWQMNSNKGLIDFAELFIEKIAPVRPRAILAVAGEWLVPNHPQVRGLGYVSREELPLWYSAASTYVLPSKGDNFPYTVLEAMACECPVVATDVGGISEQIQDGATGRLVPRGDASALAGTLLEVLSDRERSRQLGHAARHSVQEHFSADLFRRRHIELYESLLPTASVGSCPETESCRPGEESGPVSIQSSKWTS